MEVSPAQLLEQAKERFGLEDYYGAIHLLQDLVQTGRAFADAYHLLGLSYHFLGQPDRALEQFDKALDLNPNYVEAHLHRGLVLNEIGRSDEAEVAFAAARQSRGSDTTAGIAADLASKLANLHAELGEAYVEAGALDDAVSQYRRALELGPTFHDLRFRMARILLDAGRSLEARDELSRVVEARPGFLDGRATLGLACYLSGDANSARRIWSEMAAEHPGDRRVAAYMALLERAGERPA